MKRRVEFRAGFTLLEISMVVVIGLMILGLAMPGMRGVFAEQRLRERMEQFEGFVARASTLARDTKREVRIRWEPEGLRIVTEADPTEEGAALGVGEDFLSLEKEEVVLLKGVAARDLEPLSEWSFWKEGVREPVEVAYDGPVGSWQLRFGALVFEPDLLQLQAR